MRQKLALIFLILLSCGTIALSAEEKIIMQLLFPKANNAKAQAPAALQKPVEISGKIILDITPYPSAIDKDRYLTEYFLDDHLLFQSSGTNNNDNLDFTYTFDTTQYANGRYKLIVNFWDKAGDSAIAIKKITINNQNE